MEPTVFIWMFLVLKIPIVAALLLIWWAVKEPEPAAEEDGGGSRDPHHRPRPRPPSPRGRGQHGVHPAGAPRRVRAAIGRRFTRHGR